MNYHYKTNICNSLDDVERAVKAMSGQDYKLIKIVNIKPEHQIMLVFMAELGGK